MVVDTDVLVLSIGYIPVRGITVLNGGICIFHEERT